MHICARLLDRSEMQAKGMKRSSRAAGCRTEAVRSEVCTNARCCTGAQTTAKEPVSCGKKAEPSQ